MFLLRFACVAFFSACIPLSTALAQDAQRLTGAINTIADALELALSELPDDVAAKARLEYLDATYVNDAGLWDIDLRVGATLHLVRVLSSGEISARTRQDERGGDPEFWRQLPPAHDVTDTYNLDVMLGDSRTQLDAQGLIPGDAIVVRFRQPGPRSGNSPQPSVTDIFREIDGEEMARRLVYVGGVFDRMVPTKMIRIDLPQVAPPSAKTPTVAVPDVDIPVVELPDVDPPLIDVPEISLPEIEVREDDDVAIIRMPGDILFDFDESYIRPDAATSLAQVLELLNARYPDAPFTIHGHTDAKGSDAYNFRLSEARAASVRTWFAANGVPVGRMAIVAHGETRPLAANTNADGSDNPVGRQLNRRVEIAVSRR